MPETRQRGENPFAFLRPNATVLRAESITADRICICHHIEKKYFKSEISLFQ